MSFQCSIGPQFFHLQGPRSPRRRFSLCIFLHFPLTPISDVKIFSTVDCCHTLSIYMGPEVLTVVTTKNTVFGVWYHLMWEKCTSVWRDLAVSTPSHMSWLGNSRSFGNVGTLLVIARYNKNSFWQFTENTTFRTLECLLIQLTALED